MRLAWNEVCARLGFGARALLIGATVTLACSGGDEFTSAAGGSSGTSGGGSGGGGTAGSAGTAGNGGMTGSGGTGGSTTGGSHGAGGRSGSGGGGTTGSSGADGGGTAGTSGSAGSATGGTAGASTGGTAGSAGTSGSGGTGGSAGTAGTGGTTTCRWAVAGACPTGQYCNALGCENGTCMPLPAEGSTKNPVCGCDGITYWNPSVAGHRGMSVRSTGECVPARTCGGIANIPCPSNDMLCNMKGPNSTVCVTSDLGGACWVVPSVCPSGPGFGPNTRACGATACKAECELIKSQEPWYTDGTCPQ